MIDNMLIGPFILEERMTGRNYLRFLEDSFVELLEDVPLATRTTMYFQHDGAPPHSTIRVREHLTNMYPNRWIGRGSTINWPPRSPDLTPLDFCLWGWMKSLVYRRRVDTRDQLLGRIMDAAAFIREHPEALRQATQHVLARVRKCIEVDGGIFEPLL